MSDAFHGYGSTWKVGDATSPEVFTAIAEVVSITPGAMTTEAIDVTHLTSPDTHRERIAGIKDTDPFSMVVNYLPANATQKGGTSGRGLLKLKKDRTVFNSQIVLADAAATVWPFTGFISNIQIGDVTVDDKVTMAVEVTLTKQVTTIP